MRLCFSAQEIAHLTGKILLGAGSNEVGMSTNIVPITLQLALIGFFHWESFHNLRCRLTLTSIWEQWELLATVTITVNRLSLEDNHAKIPYF